VGTFLVEAIGNAERLINNTAETAKDILSWSPVSKPFRSHVLRCSEDPRVQLSGWT
jgi:hypothetical protein